MLFSYDPYDDDHGPPDSPEGDSEADHVWADLARSEAEPPEGYDNDDPEYCGCEVCTETESE